MESHEQIIARLTDEIEWHRAEMDRRQAHQVGRLLDEVRAMLRGVPERVPSEAQWSKVELRPRAGIGSPVIVAWDVNGVSHALETEGYLLALPGMVPTRHALPWRCGIVHLPGMEGDDGEPSTWITVASLCMDPECRAVIIGPAGFVELLDESGAEGETP